MRLIDADALFEPNENTDNALIFGRRSGGKLIALAEKLMRERVSMAPTLSLDDLRPKGRWEEIEETSSGWKQHRCSVCKEEAIFEYTYTDDYDEGIDGEWEYIGQREDGIIEHLTDFCPSCGADVRGGGEDG